MAHYKITVLEFGYMDSVPGDFFYDGFYNADKSYYQTFTMTLLQGEGHNILFDTGYNDKNPAKHERFITITGGQNAHSSDELLATVGLKPEDIDIVILSHAHWDHAGATELYPNATFYIQREEFDAWNRLLERPEFSWTCWLSTDKEDLDKLAELRKEGRLLFTYEEVDNFLPGIHIRISEDAHTRNMQMLLVDNDLGTENYERYVLAADAYYFPDSAFEPQTMTGGLVPAKKFATGDAFKSIETMIRIRNWANNDPKYAITAHDGTMFNRYPTEVSELGLHVVHVCE